MDTYNTYKTPLKRLGQYGSKYVFVRNGKLFCVACDCVLNHEKKFLIDQHFKTNGHMRMATMRAEKSAELTPDEYKHTFGEVILSLFTNNSFVFNYMYL